MYPFSYEVVYYNSLENAYYLESGMSMTSNYEEAMNILTCYYGETLRRVTNLTLYTEYRRVIKLPPSVIRKYENEEYISKRCCDSRGREYTSENACGSEG